MLTNAVTQQAISAYENGSKDIGTEMLSEFADFFDCSTDYLQGKTPTRKWDTEGLAFSAHDIDGLTDEDIAAAKLIIEGLKAKHQTKKKYNSPIRLDGAIVRLCAVNIYLVCKYPRVYPTSIGSDAAVYY